jgi:dienelactone hydrolase
MVALTEQDGGAAGAPHDNPVRAAAAFYPLTDLVTMDSDLPGVCAAPPKTNISACSADASSPVSRLLGCPLLSCTPALVESASPITFVDRHDPPILLLHGTLDDTVGWRQSQQMFDAAHAAGAPAQLILIPHGRHNQAGEFLYDPAVRAGATSTTTVDGTNTGPAPITLGPNVLVDFFDEAMR